MSPQTILIPVEFPDPQPLPSTFVDAFSSCRVVLLGLDEMSDDVDADERHRREIRAKNVLYSLATQFLREGESADVELVTGEGLSETPTRVAEERGVDAVMIPKPITTLGRVLVPVRDPRFAEPVAEFLSGLNQDVFLHTTLFHVAESEDDVEAGEQVLSDIREQLVEAGHPELRLDSETVVSDDPAFAISEAASDYDIIVMGETENPSFDSVFGKTYELVADETNHPVVVVRDTN